MSTNAAQEAENLEIEQIEARINADRNLTLCRYKRDSRLYHL